MKTARLLVATFLLLPLTAWAAEKEKAETHVTMDQLPAAAKATIEKESGGATVEEIEKETEGGKTFYEAEIIKNGRESFIQGRQGPQAGDRGTGAQIRAW